MKKFAIIFIVLFSGYANAKCNFINGDFIDEMMNPSNISSINVHIPKSSKFAINAFKIITSRTGNIPPKLRKTFKGVVSVQYKFGECIYPAKIRQSGDVKDHISFLNDKPIRSLDVKLKFGNILNAVKFKLLLPTTRNGKNEILAALILRQLGFIAPETFEVKTVVNGVKSLMLFQEKASKELLERNHRREGPIFEGDESILWSKSGFKNELRPLALARLSNANWAKKGSVSEQIVLKSYKKIQNAYLRYAKSAKKNSKSWALFPNSLKNETFINYHSALFAVNGSHGLAPNNRKYYYNIIEAYFEPIYYDGDVNLNSFLKEPKPFFELLPMRPSEKFIESISNFIGTDSLKNKFFDRTVYTTDRKDFFLKSIKQFKNNFSVLISNIEDSNHSDRRLLFSAIEDNSWYAKFQQNKRLKQKIVTKINFDHSDSFVYLKDGSKIKISRDDLIKIMTRNKLKNQRAVFIPEIENDNIKGDFEFIRIGSKLIKTSKGMDVKINKEKKWIKFTQSVSKDWALIFGGDYSNWKFFFQGTQLKRQTPEFEGQRFNQFGLTGCLTLYKVILNNTNFNLNSGGCEDSINFINSDGERIKLLVLDAFSDAVDADFSRLSFSRLEVINAGNDCLDVSSGRYNLKKAELSECKDKAISIGESSNLKAQKVFINNSNIGVSVKDFSKVFIYSLEASKVALCSEVKRKKQEFGGAYLAIDNFNCESSYFVDEESKFLKGN